VAQDLAISRLVQLRRTLESCFRTGERPRVVIAGRGVTAVEIAGNIARLAAANAARVVVTGARWRRATGANAARRTIGARHHLSPAGAGWRLEAKHAITAGAASEPFDFLVNATGLEPAPLLRTLGLPFEEDGALIVDAHLQSSADLAILRGGDGVAFCGRTLAKIGVYAIRQGPVLFHNLKATVEGTPLARFQPQRRFLWIMNLGDGTGVAVRRQLHWQGRAAFRLKDWIDRRFLRQAARPVKIG
jgi:NADH dehydrogenase FAD-containing subunit